jgi:hypothetical protein
MLCTTTSHLGFTPEFELVALYAGMSQAYVRKMGATRFVAALFNAGVVPARVMHLCLDELLPKVRPAGLLSNPRALALVGLLVMLMPWPYATKCHLHCCHALAVNLRVVLVSVGLTGTDYRSCSSSV